MKTAEIWKDITGYEGRYQVSNNGEVKSMERLVNGHNSPKKRYTLLLRKVLNKGGYFRVALSIACKHKTFTIHQLVAKHFIPNPENKPQVNHKNGIKTDNSVENLEWATPAENMRHAFRLGLIKSGDAIPIEIRNKMREAATKYWQNKREIKRVA